MLKQFAWGCVALAILGLTIGLTFALAFSHFHHSSSLPPNTAQSEESRSRPDGGTTYIYRESDDYFDKVIEPIAISTFVLCMITGALALFTYGLFDETSRLAADSSNASAKALEASTEHTQTLFNAERAYLVGGGQVAIAGKTFQVGFSNYGKTPAFIYAFGIEFAMLAEVETPQEVFPMRYFEDVIPPHPGGGTPQRIVLADIVPPNAEVAYGAFWYEDWQKKVHIFRFILRIVPGASMFGSTSVSLPGIDPSFTYRD